MSAGCVDASSRAIAVQIDAMRIMRREYSTPKRKAADFVRSAAVLMVRA
jgi:hypothetical protein